MGISTNGQLCFGIIYNDGYEFPWDNSPYNGDYEEWWLVEIHGYKPPFQLYDERGEYLNGKEPSKSQRDAYYKHKFEFKKQHPFPVKVGNYCSGDYPMYMIAVPNSFYSNHRGSLIEIDPDQLKVTVEEVNALVDFCKTYCCAEMSEFTPKWYLSSYWG